MEWTVLRMTHLEYLARAIHANASAREELWTEAQEASGTDDARLRLALMQSLAGHSGYAPAVAERELSELQARTESREIAAVASIRLAAMKESAECGTRLRRLEERLSRIADIERAMDEEND